MKPRYAQVVVDIAASTTNQAYDYLLPPAGQHTLKPGQLVRVPFGHRRVQGLVTSLSETTDVPGEQLKQVAAVESSRPVIPPHLIDLAQWLSRRYLCHIAQSLRCILPSGFDPSQLAPKTVQALRLAQDLDDTREAIESDLQRAPRQRQVLSLLARVQEPLTRPAIKERLGCSDGPLRALEDKQLVEVVEVEQRRDPLAGRQFASREHLQLTPGQQQVMEQLKALLEESRGGHGRAALLHGVTGSGKTEVYLQLIEEVLEGGGQAIVMVPEISLTVPMVRQLKERFGSGVAVLHSALGRGERLDEWRRIRAGEVSVAVGPRSAVFAPFDRLKLMVLDEEHETSYKQGETPRYHARDVALQRAKAEGALVLLGSATPAVESYARAAGEPGAFDQPPFELLELPQRIDGRPLPAVRLVDMRAELKSGNRSMFSRDLTSAIEQRLERGEQVILFLNRRGYSAFVLCRACGMVIQCPHCDVSLTYHSSGQLWCHYCDFHQPAPSSCPHCGSRYIRHFGTGTQKVEQAVKRLFPSAQSVRMDVDTTRRKGAHERLYQQFRSGRAQVLIGTQMVAKGFDIPAVTLVGVITADTALNLPDFRSAERTFNLLTQVAGRAGRGELGGEVIVQTYTPDHYAIQAAREHDYQRFFEQEIEFRRQLAYPPFAVICRWIVASEVEEDGSRASSELGLVARGLADDYGVEVTGPAPAPLFRLRGSFRWQLLTLASSHQNLLTFCRRLQEEWRQHGQASARLSVDVDPLAML